MKMNIEMSTVDACAATACAYNVEQSCQARAITIGEGMHPSCDTFVEAGRHVHVTPEPAGVGACKVEVCRFNNDLECSAASIQVERHSQHADCATFDRR